MNNRSNKAVANFLSTMLDESTELDELKQQPLARLLAQVSDNEHDLSSQVIDPTLLHDRHQTEVTPPAASPLVEEPRGEDRTIEELTLEATLASRPAPKAAQQGNALQNELDDVFPVLYFGVAEYTFAVPLIKLKAIYRLNEPTKIFGKPDWFSGIQVEREENLAVVDTGRFLMPEKFNSSAKSSTEYKYIVVLEDSNWGLKCDSLIDSENVSQNEIKWRTKGTSSPWLAGTVKQRMCGLLAVDALIELFEQNTSS